MTTRSRYTAAVNDKPWWLAGGIPQSACVAAYQAKGASSYEASKVNLANPGTYNAVDGGAYPTWSTNVGWTFNGTTRYLDSGILPTENMSVIICFDGATTPGNAYPTLFGNIDGTRSFYIHPRTSINNRYYIHGNVTKQKIVSGNLDSGVVAIAKYDVYLNGVLEVGTGKLSEWRGVSSVTMPIGKRNDGYHYAGNMQAIAFYSIELTNSQVSALTNAMNAL